MSEQKYVYTVQFNEKVGVWQSVTAEIVSDKQLTDEEIEKRVKDDYDYDEISTELDWSECTREDIGEITIESIEPLRTESEDE